MFYGANYPTYYPHPQPASCCPQTPGTVLRIYIPAGAEVNLLNLVELSSPSGVCLIAKVPMLGGTANLSGLLDSIKRVGGNVEFIN